MNIEIDKRTIESLADLGVRELAHGDFRNKVLIPLLVEAEDNNLLYIADEVEKIFALLNKVESKLNGIYSIAQNKGV